MANAYVTFQQAGVRGQFGNVPVAIGPYQSEIIATSAASAVGTKIANKFDVATIVCATTVVAVAGAAPVATMALGKVCFANCPTDIFLQPGDKIALIDG